MPYFPQAQFALAQSADYTSRTLTDNTGVRPNLERPTLVSASWLVDTNANGSSGEVLLEISPDNATWTEAARVRLNQPSGQARQAEANPMTAIIPPGYFYKTRTNTIAGTVTYTFISCRELTL